MCKFLLLLFLLPCFVWAQMPQTYYYDILKDKKGKPLEGVSVINKTNLRRTITNKDGLFELRANAGDIIVISYTDNLEKKIIVADYQLKTLEPVMLQVDPILSKDYMDMVTSSSVTMAGVPKDSMNNIQQSTLHFKGQSYVFNNVKGIDIKDNQLVVYPYYKRHLTLGGSYNTAVEANFVNQLPALQKQYVQGRPQNGMLNWRGAETNELFSYGPALQSVEYNGQPYDYDVKGKLVAAGTGNGQQPFPYNNSIFRKSFLYKQSVYVHGSVLTRGYIPALIFSFKLGDEKESMVIKENTNSNRDFHAMLGATVKRFSITGIYDNRYTSFSNGNRNGLLNRVYQNALLTPISFDNAQGATLLNGQRSYSNKADNPTFLLQENQSGYSKTQNNVGLTIEYKGKVNFKLIPSLESVKEGHVEYYKVGTAGFENGSAINRKQRDFNYSLLSNASYRLPSKNYRINTSFAVNYQFDHQTTNIDYVALSHHYQRFSQSASIVANSSLILRNFDAGINIANKLYASNTSLTNSFLLPSIGGFAKWNNVLDFFDIKLASSFTRFNNELPINRSMAYINLLKYNTAQAFQYLPIQEVNSFKNLRPIHHKEWAARLEIGHANKFTLSAETFIKNVAHDIFPVFENGLLNLKNVAAHRTSGTEFQLSWNKYETYGSKLSTSHSLSFFTYKNKVTSVEGGYDYLPVSGLANVHKALVDGQSLGAIVGSSYVRDANRNILIRTDGFPMMNSQPKVIGNTVPDFVMKLANSLRWKKLSINADLEWRKGGDIWNGTQATLDYYGRSQYSGDVRNTNNFIFDGVQANGQKNQLPVSFLDVNQPLENNRWTRYGPSGIAEEYIQKGDCLRINSVVLAYRLDFKKYIQNITIATYLNNLILWSAYRGTDVNQLLYDQPNSEGLDFFNLPSTKTIGFSLTVQF